MLRQISKIALLVALLTGFVVSSAPAFAAYGARSSVCWCSCYWGSRPCVGLCKYDATSLQCINISCKGGCFGGY